MQDVSEEAFQQNLILKRYDTTRDIDVRGFHSCRKNIRPTLVQLNLIFTVLAFFPGMKSLIYVTYLKNHEEFSNVIVDFLRCCG